MTAQAAPVSQRRVTPLVAVGLVAVPLLLVVPAYLYRATFSRLFAGEVEYAGDFLFYVEGTQRFLADPATLYAGSNFLYPPPSLLLFVPLVQLPVAWGYTVLALLNAVALAVSVGLFIHLYERSSGARMDGWSRGALFAVAFVSAPFFQTVKMGQVNGLVLLAGLAFLVLLPRRPMAAAGVLTLGFWLKLYPLVLAVLGLMNVRRGRLALGFALGLLVFPLLLLPLFSTGLYADYAEFVVSSGNLSNVAAMNQGLPAVLTRLTLPPEAFTTYTGHSIGFLPRVVTIAVGLGAGLALVGAYVRGRLSLAEAGVGLLALLPLVSVLGWEHTYILALPLVWWMLLEAASASKRVQVTAV
ncbi:MAG: DUF2029 domain-containing protein, partial [Bacteroidetes bacterium]|nr:DUF2029 domain-containing protein [Bacteroidota bacterium]